MKDQQAENNEIIKAIATLQSDVKNITNSLAELKQDLRLFTSSQKKTYVDLDNRVHENTRRIDKLESCKQTLEEHEDEIKSINLKIAKWGGIIATVATVANILIDKIWK